MILLPELIGSIAHISCIVFEDLHCDSKIQEQREEWSMGIVVRMHTTQAYPDRLRGASRKYDITCTSGTKMEIQYANSRRYDKSA